MTIKWDTLITEPQEGGRISLHRLRKFSTIVAFWCGCLVAIVATLVEVLGGVEVPTSMILITVGALVAPIMGGQVSDAIFGTRLSKKIQAGEAPGRRARDSASTTVVGPTMDVEDRPRA